MSSALSCSPSPTLGSFFCAPADNRRTSDRSGSPQKYLRKGGRKEGRPCFTLSLHLDLMVSLARYSLNLPRSVRRPASLFGTAFGGGLKRTEQRVRIGEVECGSFPSSFSLFLCILVQREGLREGRASKGRVFGILHPTKKAS